MNKKILILSVVFFACANFLKLNAQSWSLEKCISYALENNIQIKQQRLNVEYQQNVLFQSKANALPNLNLGADQNYTWGRSVDPYTNDFINTKVRSNNLYASASVTLFNGFQNYNTIKQNEFNLMANLQSVEKIKNDIALLIATSYLQILFYEDLSAVAKNQLELTQLQIDRTKKLVEAGTMARGNLLEIQAQAASEELQLINAKNQLLSANLTLIQILDLKNDTAFSIVRPEIPELDESALGVSVDDVYKQALNLPQIKSAQFQLKSSEKSLDIATGARSPKIMLSGSYYTGYSDARKNYTSGPMERQQIGLVNGDVNQPVFTMYPTMIPQDYPFSSQLKDNASKSIAIRISIPIFNNYQVQTSVSNSKINILNSQYKLQIAENNLYKDIQQSHADALAALAKYKGSKKALEANEEAFKYAEQKFNVGTVNSIDYNTAKTKFTKAKSDALQAKFEYLFKKSILDFYSGKPIKI